MNRTILVLLLAAMVSGCSVYRGYDGPRRSEHTIAILDVGSAFANDANIHLVDGKSRGFGLINTYELLPGERELTVGLATPGYDGEIVVTYFEAEAGKQYTIEAVMEIERVKGIFGLSVFAGGNGTCSSKRRAHNVS